MSRGVLLVTVLALAGCAAPGAEPRVLPTDAGDTPTSWVRDAGFYDALEQARYQPHAYFSDSIEGKAYTPEDLKELATEAATSDEPEAWWIQEFIDKPLAAPNVNADIRVPFVVLPPGRGGDLVVNLKPVV